MCADPTCKACSIKKLVDDEARTLAVKLSNLLSNERPSLNKDYHPLVMIRALQGCTAAICAKASGDGGDVKYSMFAIERAIRDLLDIFSQMDGGIPTSVSVEHQLIGTNDGDDAFMPPRLRIPPSVH